MKGTQRGTVTSHMQWRPTVSTGRYMVSSAAWARYPANSPLATKKKSVSRSFCQHTVSICSCRRTRHQRVEAKQGQVSHKPRGRGIPRARGGQTARLASCAPPTLRRVQASAPQTRLMISSALCWSQQLFTTLRESPKHDRNEDTTHTRRGRARRPQALRSSSRGQTACPVARPAARLGLRLGAGRSGSAPRQVP